jgi:hypothetical protein
VCNCLAGTAKTDCQALLTCVSPGFFSCLFTPPTATPRCYCSDSACSNGANGPCAAQFNAVAGSSDPAVVIQQLNDPSTTVARVVAEGRRFGNTAACGMYCACL